MFIKKKGDKGKDGAQPGPQPGAEHSSPASSASRAAEAPPAAPPQAPVKQSQTGLGSQAATGAMPGLQGAGSSMSGLRAATGEPVPGSSQTGMAPAEAPSASGRGGKNPYKISVVFDIVIPLSLSIVCCGGFLATVKRVPDRTGVYGIDPEDAELVVKDKTLIVPTLMAEVAALPPAKLLAKGDETEAVAAAKALATKSPADVRALLCAGQVLIEVGAKADRDLGLSYIKKAAEIAPFSKYVRIAYAKQLSNMRMDDEAIKVLEKVCRKFPDAGTAAHKELATLYMETSRSADAVNELTALTKSDPNDPTIQRMLGLAIAQDGRQQEGFDVFQQGFTKEQDAYGCPAAVKPLVDAHAGILQAALDEAIARTKKNPRDVKSMLNLARLYVGANKLKEARDTLEAARKVQELNPEIHEVMAEVMVRQNQATSAFDEFRAAVNQINVRN